MSNNPSLISERMRAAVEGAANSCAERLSQEFPSVRWDFSPGTLAELDKLVMDAWSEKAPGGDLQWVAAMLAAYVGEVLVRSLPGARWSMEAVPGADEDGKQLAVNVRSPAWSFVDFPFGWVCKRLDNGEIDSLVAKYELSVQLTRPATPEKR